MTLLKDKIKRAGQVVITSLMIGVYAATAFWATGTALAENVDTSDIASNITTISQEVASDTLGALWDGLSFLLWINSTNASYDGDSSYAALDKKIDKVLVGFYKKIEKKVASNNGRIKVLQKISKKIQLIKQKKGNNIKPQLKHIIDYLDASIQNQISKYQKICSNKSTTKQTIEKKVVKTETVKDNKSSQVDNSNKTTTSVKDSNKSIIDDSNYDNETKDYIKNWGVVVELKKSPTSIDERINTLNNVKKVWWTNYVLNIDNPDTSKIASVISTWQSIEDIQKFTQWFSNQEYRDSGLAYFWASNEFKVKLRDWTTQRMQPARLGSTYAMMDMSPAFNPIKYHYQMNGVIKKGTQKYEDYRHDFFATAWGWFRNDGWMVKLEPLALWKTIEKKIENNEHMTSAEIKRAWETALKMENLDDKYSIITKSSFVYSNGTKTMVPWYAVIDTKSSKVISKWKSTGGKLGTVSSFIQDAGPSAVEAYLFAR